MRFKIFNLLSFMFVENLRGTKSEKVLPVLTTCISHPSSSSYNNFCVLCSTRHQCEKPLFRKKENDEEIFFFLLFSTCTNTHIHTQSHKHTLDCNGFFSFFLLDSHSLSPSTISSSCSFYIIYNIFYTHSFRFEAYFIFLLDDDYTHDTITLLCIIFFFRDSISATWY